MTIRLDATTLTALVTAVALLISNVTALWIALQTKRVVVDTHTNTNSTLAALTARANAAIENQATAAELAARPVWPRPPSAS
jgi:hypothetical protein